MKKENKKNLIQWQTKLTMELKRNSQQHKDL